MKSQEIFFEKVSEDVASCMQPLVLAMIGDSVQTLFARTFIAEHFGVKVSKMNKMVSSLVSSGAQFKFYVSIEDEFSEAELAIAKRARNTHIRHTAKNFSVNEYIHATALEAVFGYLFLTGQDERLNYFLNKSVQNLKVE